MAIQMPKMRLMQAVGEKMKALVRAQPLGIRQEAADQSSRHRGSVYSPANTTILNTFLVGRGDRVPHRRHGVAAAFRAALWGVRARADSGASARAMASALADTVLLLGWRCLGKFSR